MNATNEQNTVVCLDDVTTCAPNQIVVLEWDLARYQRAGKRARQSANSSGYHVIERGGVWLRGREVGAIVRRDGAMDAEMHRL